MGQSGINSVEGSDAKAKSPIEPNETPESDGHNHWKSY